MALATPLSFFSLFSAEGGGKDKNSYRDMISAVEPSLPLSLLEHRHAARRCSVFSVTLW